ncbi:MAG TPA: hypothetical protein VME92_08445 [Acetobacteraceae bacterium]|nr:hypothetical protein [Acetobacteraceae bacterium]
MLSWSHHRPGRLTRAGTSLALLSSVLLGGAGPLRVGAAPRCENPQNEASFDVLALRSELMVLATACNDSSGYNEFVNRYKPELADNEHEISAYFSRTYGRRGQQMHDAYVTNLANSQADGLQTMGTDFCPHTRLIVDEVMALPSATDLSAYAAGKDLVPASLGACEVGLGEAPSTTEHHHYTKRTRKGHAG